MAHHSTLGSTPVAAMTTSTPSASPDVSVASSGHSPRVSSNVASSQFIATRTAPPAPPSSRLHSCCSCATQSGPTAAPPELLPSASAVAHGTSGGVPGTRAASTPCRNVACKQDSSHVARSSHRRATHRVAVEERVANAAVADRPDHLVPRLRVQRVAARQPSHSARRACATPGRARTQAPALCRRCRRAAHGAPCSAAQRARARRPCRAAGAPRARLRTPAAAAARQRRRTGDRTEARRACRLRRRREAPVRTTQLSAQAAKASACCSRSRSRLALRVHARRLRLQHVHRRLPQPVKRPLDNWRQARIRTSAALEQRSARAPSNTSARRVTRSTFSTHCAHPRTEHSSDSAACEAAVRAP